MVFGRMTPWESRCITNSASRAAVNPQILLTRPTFQPPDALFGRRRFFLAADCVSLDRSPWRVVRCYRSQPPCAFAAFGGASDRGYGRHTSAGTNKSFAQDGFPADFDQCLF